MYAAAWCFKDSSLQLYNHYGELEYGHKSAIARGEKALVLKTDEIEKIINAPDRKEGLLMILCKKEVESFSKGLPLGKQIMTDGEICAFYYQPPKENKEKK